MKPQRIQRRRVKGWRAPPNTVYVGRGSKWGNPFVLGQPCGVFPEGMGIQGKAEVLIPALTKEQVVEFYRDMVEGFLRPEMFPYGHEWRGNFVERMGWSPRDAARSLLRGKNLMCWCGQDDACHADVLLEIANRE